MSVTSASVAEIKSYVEDFSVDSLFAHPKSALGFSTAYKQLHSLLIWTLLVEEKEFPEAQFGKHPIEGISDISQSFALLAFSLYKPARVMARSAIENIVRVVVADKGGDYQVKSVYALFDNATGILAGDATALAVLAKLKTLYSELCLSVHSAHPDHVALRVPFEKVFAYDEDQSLMTIKLLRLVALGLNQLLYARFSIKLSKITHKNRDTVLDSLPKAIKRAVQTL